MLKEEFEDTKWVVRIRKLNDRQHNGLEEKDNDLQNATQKTKDRTTRTPLKTGVNSNAMGEHLRKGRGS